MKLGARQLRATPRRTTTYRTLLVAGLCITALAGCDALFEPEGAGPPPPDLPPPPPLEDTNDTGGAPDISPPPSTPAETPTLDMGDNAANSATDPALGTQISAPVTDLASLNAVACTAVSAGETKTVAQAAGATESQIDKSGLGAGGLATTSVVGAVGSASSLSVLLADFPGLVKLEPRRAISETSYASGHCGATRIATNWFVTAAHCLDEPYDVTILKGGSELLTGPITEQAEASWSICHAAYEGVADGLSNDVALIRISDAQAAKLDRVPIASIVSPNADITPVSLPHAAMAGWGMTAPQGSLSNVLLGTDVDVASVGPALIRVRSVNGRGPCIGDSGGPLFAEATDGKRYLVGVLSGVEQAPGRQACEGDYTARYTNLQGYKHWIDNVIQACNTQDGLCGPVADPS